MPPFVPPSMTSFRLDSELKRHLKQAMESPDVAASLGGVIKKAAPSNSGMVKRALAAFDHISAADLRQIVGDLILRSLCHTRKYTAVDFSGGQKHLLCYDAGPDGFHAVATRVR